MPKIFTAILLTLSLAACSLSGGIKHIELGDTVSFSHGDAAERLREKGKYKAAIREYYAHIRARERVTERAEDENPYFYLLLIAECYLELKDFKKAEELYSEALAKDVEKSLIADGVRQIASRYEALGQFEEGIEVLRKFRELDELLIDAIIDRLHKKSVAREQGAEEA